MEVVSEARGNCGACIRWTFRGDSGSTWYWHACGPARIAWGEIAETGAEFLRRVFAL